MASKSFTSGDYTSTLKVTSSPGQVSIHESETRMGSNKALNQWIIVSRSEALDWLIEQLLAAREEN